MATKNRNAESPPRYRKLDKIIGVRVSEEEHMRAEILSRYAQSKSMSDYLRSPVQTFLDREQKRFGISDAQIARDAETLRGEKRRTASGE